MRPPDPLVRHFQLRHERLHHSVDGPEDARGRARYLEERARTGMSTGLGPGAEDRVVVVKECVCLQVKQAVLAALDCGYRHIDCAAAYGNEQEVGEALALRVGAGKVSNRGRGKAHSDSTLTLDGAFWCTVFPPLRLSVVRRCL